MNTPILDVVIGLALTFLLVAIIASGINEWIAAVTARRAKLLEQALTHFLRDYEHKNRFYQHPLISLLVSGKGQATSPSYIPPASFARAFLDALPGTEIGKPTTVDDVRRALDHIQDSALKTALEVFLAEAGDDIDKLRKEVEKWYVSAMDRVSGWYKRHAQAMILVITVCVTVVFNIDSVAIAKSLWADPALRQQVVALAEQTVSQTQPDDAQQARQQATSTLLSLSSPNFPVGKTPLEGIAQNGLWNTLLGWLITAAAASLGAPFWFDLVNKLVNLRSSGKRPNGT